ncbi:hypothetical protein R3P38DRAFT_2759001 [Favolaschia claudopus]|uniref:Uncharacterized protein n=1 Tax=Favolaschia claudopus TaxID=2862362 RepID=A0AAW0E5B4_9AGAR
MEINGGDDGSADETISPAPTRREALQAVGILRRYLEETDSPFARHLEHGLAAFGRETQLERTKLMVSTSITDYFMSSDSECDEEEEEFEDEEDVDEVAGSEGEGDDNAIGSYGYANL